MPQLRKTGNTSSMLSLYFNNCPTEDSGRKGEKMSSERCPKCHSGDTRPAYGNYAKQILDVGAKVGALFLLHGTPLANNVHGALHETKDKKIKKQHCNACGYEW